MHPTLLEYAQRYHRNPTKKLEISAFFTSLGQNYQAELPYLYDIELACDRLVLALDQGQKVCIYSDYDTDAVTATAAMYWGLIMLGFDAQNLSFYAPDRFTEGYGMNTEAVATLCDQYDLLVSVDCGINSVNEAKICQQKGVDLIITDHHHLSGDLPECLAVINPRLSAHYTPESNKFVGKQNYLSSSATGVGVAWFVVVWLAYKLKFELGRLEYFDFKDLNQLLSFVAIGTVADCQSILDQTNRLLVKAGLKIIQSLATQTSPNEILYGLWLLLEQTGLQNQIQNGYKMVSSDLGFTLSPILNSSGRLSHASHSIEAVLAGNIFDKKVAAELVSALIATNNQRKQEVAHILAEVESQAKTQFELGKKIIWVASTGWSKGLIGLLASRLVNQFNLPVVVVELPSQSAAAAQETQTESNATASLRAPEGYNLPVAMQEIGDLFLKFGGHPGAAGFSAKLESLDQIESGLETALFTQKQGLNSAPKVDYSNIPNLQTNLQIQDSKLSGYCSKISSLWLTQEVLEDPNFWPGLLDLEPFGQDFLSPVLVFSFKVGTFSTLSQGLHLKFDTETQISDSKLSLIWFNFAKSGFDVSQLESGKEFWVVGRPQQNAWKNRLGWQVVVDTMVAK